MAYQRTEYADKTLSMNSLADRKLRIQLGTLDTHRGTIAKEMNREKKKLERELAEAEDYMRNHLSVADPDGRKLSPRLPRRFSTPPSILSASLPPPDPRRSPVANRRRVLSDGIPEPLNPAEFINVPPSPTALSPTSIKLLRPPFNQPRRQSLPPIGLSGLVAIDHLKREELGLGLPGNRGDRRGSFGAGGRSPGNISPISTSGSTSPRVLSRKGSSVNEAQMNEVKAKVSRFLQKIDTSEKEKASAVGETPNQAGEEAVYVQEDGIEGSIHDLAERQSTVKRSVAGLFQPANFE